MKIEVTTDWLRYVTAGGTIEGRVIDDKALQQTAQAYDL